MNSSYVEKVITAPVSRADTVLNLSATFWFVIAVLGQWIFVYYIAVVYGGAILQGEAEVWSDTTLKGYVPSDVAGNVIFGLHVAMAIIISFGGTLQLVPQIRKHVISFHRWNGRLFIFTAFMISLGGLYLVWVRESTTTMIGSLGISLNAVLIMIFAALAIQRARTGNIVSHRKWALRTFIVANGVWFFRVGLMAWYIINQGPAGSTEKLDGPFDMVWAFANFLLPLILLELYFLAQSTSDGLRKTAVAIIILISTIVMAIGIFGATMFMWSPNF
ncbi:MAG: DUF2306 domain-containing protein [Saprospiraceae bacterium]|nr:DUF2306 domain-containing protein [Saprospiraceae bacterium]